MTTQPHSQEIYTDTTPVPALTRILDSHMTAVPTMTFSCVKHLGPVRPFAADELTFSQRKGIQYEKRVGKKILLWAALHDVCACWVGEWIEYDGRLAQPDFVLFFPDNRAILFEAKLTWVDTTQQLALYEALLNVLGFTGVIKVTVCKNLCHGVDRAKIVRSLDDIYDGCVLQMRS